MALFWLYSMYFVLFSLIEKSTKQLHKSYNKNDFILQNFIPDLFLYMEETGNWQLLDSRNIPGYVTQNFSTDALYCGYCVIFSSNEAKDKLFINPVTDWVNLSKYVSRHEKPNTSHSSSVIAGENIERVKSGKASL